MKSLISKSLKSRGKIRIIRTLTLRKTTHLSFSVRKLLVLSSRAIIRAISRWTICIFMAVKTNITLLAIIMTTIGPKKYIIADQVRTEEEGKESQTQFWSEY